MGNTPTTDGIELIGTIKVDTGKAILFVYPDLDDPEIIRQDWYPISQIKEIHHEDPVRMIVSAWIYGCKQREWKD